jgi:predicted nucleic acid-binding protein
MPDVVRSVVINTTPLIALAVGVGNLDILRVLFDRVVVPLEVCEEIHAIGSGAPGVAAFDRADWLERLPVTLW